MADFSLKRLRVSLSLFLILLVLFNFSHFIISQKQDNIKVDYIELTKLPGVVRSVNYFEHRIIEYKDYSTTYLHDTKPIDSLGIVYE